MNTLEIKGFAQSINQMTHPTLSECNKLLVVTNHKIVSFVNETEFYHEQSNGGRALLMARALWKEQNFTARQILKGLGLNCKDIGQPTVEFHILPHVNGGNVICARIKSMPKFEEDIYGID